jgi:hypothetical protein
MKKSDDELITELARLDPLAYERRQKDSAKTLGITTAALRKIVDQKRRAIKPDKDDGQGRAVKIIDPLSWHEYVSGDAIATTLAAVIKTYVILSDEAADTVALWVLHSWTVNAFTMSPRLAIISPTKGCGKTTVLRVLNHIARRTKRTGSISPAALFRVVEKFQPTILLDETEKYIENGSDIHALLNEGHCKGGNVTRVIGDSLELREFSIYGAVAFARNGKLPDDLEQRSIIIEMQRRRANEDLAQLRDDRAESLKQIARMCSRWADDNANILLDQDPDMEMINRNADNWRPLFAIADLCGEGWPERIRAAAAILTPRESEGTGPKLLASIRAVFDERKGEWADRMFSEMLAEALTAMEGQPWAEYGKARKPITKNQLAQLLKDFKIKPDTVKIGTKGLKGYYRHQFEEVWERYLAPEGVNETEPRNQPTAAGTSTPFQNVTTESEVTFQKCEKPLPPSDCYGVTAQKGGRPLNGKSPPRCAQCGGDPDGEEQTHLIDGQTVWLHRQCRRFFIPSQPSQPHNGKQGEGTPPDDLDIPDFLKRT